MADKIINCVVTKDNTNVILQYDVSYEVENADASKKNRFCIVIKADELTNPADLSGSDTEVLSLANPKAKIVKDAWLADLPVVSNADVTTAVGDVAL